jgi:hypothetical protein
LKIGGSHFPLPIRAPVPIGDHKRQKTQAGRGDEHHQYLAKGIHAQLSAKIERSTGTAESNRNRITDLLPILTITKSYSSGKIKVNDNLPEFSIISSIRTENGRSSSNRNAEISFSCSAV